jgi:hypothetical protein
MLKWTDRLKKLTVDQLITKIRIQKTSIELLQRDLKTMEDILKEKQNIYSRHTSFIPDHGIGENNG